MAFTQIRWQMSGLKSGLGYTTFRFDGELDSATASTAAANCRTLLAALNSYLPSAAKYDCDTAATTHNIDGTLIQDVALTTVPSTVSFIGAGNWAGGAGASVAWQTGAVFLGKRVVGRTYFAPLVSTAFDTDGTLNSSLLAALRAAATAFSTSTPRPIVWSRRPASAPTAWSISPMSGATVADKAALIRSRRD